MIKKKKKMDIQIKSENIHRCCQLAFLNRHIIKYNRNIIEKKNIILIVDKYPTLESLLIWLF